MLRSIPGVSHHWRAATRHVRHVALSCSADVIVECAILPCSCRQIRVGADKPSRLCFVIAGRDLDHRRDPLDPSRPAVRTGPSKAPAEPAGLGGLGKRARQAIGRCWNIVRDSSRNPAANRNRDRRSAKPGGTLHVAQRPPPVPPAGRRHKEKAQLPEAELARRYRRRNWRAVIPRSGRDGPAGPGGRRARNDGRPHAPDQRAATAATSISMWRQNPVGTALPVACRSWEKALSDARWRAGIRRAKGRAQRQLQARPLYR
jgi:hypothetical protein